MEGLCDVWRRMSNFKDARRSSVTEHNQRLPFIDSVIQYERCTDPDLWSTLKGNRPTNY